MITRASVRLFLISVFGLLARPVVAAPAITQHPASISVTTGAQAQLSVAATGTGALSYLWQRNGFPLVSQTTATLTLPTAKISDTDTYNVVVTDSTGSTPSAAASLAVAPIAYPQSLRIDPAFDLTVESDVGGSIVAIADAGGGKVVAAGDFVRVNGNGAIRRLARFDVATGQLDSTFAPAVNGLINAVVVQSDGKIVIGGGFTQVNGASRLNIARLNTDGTTDPSFNPGAGANNNVSSLALQTIAGEQKIMVGGTFTNFNNSGRTKLVR